MPIINAVSQPCLSRRLLTFFASAVIVGGFFAALPTVANAQYCGTNDCVFDNREVSAITVVHTDPGPPRPICGQ